ncbi:RNA-binding ATPase activator ESF2 [Aspergillus mulundensis]|uniref:Pre-rRNA-processing protein ESF2 n=1 Tax=Aspergillus mulundensis TaxID=1810919 RepID=A0A3D8RYR7_9EURO|nr:Pre-rRNA-processing protein esf2 [Aspergillus mulundensis]RDW79189.1 Pre-rRNA-processing protein esf2 [Aspergillus mulundensis]
MTTRKRNEFLDIVSSDDEDNDAGYDSEAAEESKGRTVKRRKTQSRKGELESGSEDEGSDVSGGEESSDEETGGVRLSSKKREQREESGNESDDNDDQEGQYLDVSAEVEKAKSKKTLQSLDKLKTKPTKKNKTGVVYFSSLPPYLKPFALKSLLETRGFEPITKVFLTPAVKAPSAPRRRSNKRKTYTDGWVEFASKKTAKICAETLNATIVGGRKGGWYHDGRFDTTLRGLALQANKVILDVWNMKYLKGFKWADLMEQQERERSEREAKRRIEDTRARKEEKVFLQGYEKGKMLDGIQKKNEEKRRRKMAAGGGGDAGPEATVNARRLFRQNEVKQGRDKASADQSNVEEDTRRILGKIF